MNQNVGSYGRVGHLDFSELSWIPTADAAAKAAGADVFSSLKWKTPANLRAHVLTTCGRLGPRMSEPVQSQTIDALFRNLQGADILRFVEERRVEDLNLDFKLAPSNFENRDDRKTLATAISGFANAGGGLIVWGVEARPGADDVDCAQRVITIANPDLFMSRLQEHAGAACSPPVDDVQHRIIDGPFGAVAVTHVPPSDRGPHMAKLGEDRYYQRSGSRFVRMEHFQLEDMFGRRPRPKLVFVAEVLGRDAILVGIRNEGRGTAGAPFLGLRVAAPFRVSAYGVDGNGNVGLPRLIQSMSGSREAWFGNSSGSVIHPGTTLNVTRLTFDGPSSAIPEAGTELKVEYEMAAEGFPLATGTAVLVLPN